MSPVPQQANAVMGYNTPDRWREWIYDLTQRCNWVQFVDEITGELLALEEDRDMWRTMYEESSV